MFRPLSILGWWLSNQGWLLEPWGSSWTSSWAQFSWGHSQTTCKYLESTLPFPSHQNRKRKKEREMQLNSFNFMSFTLFSLGWLVAGVLCMCCECPSEQGEAGWTEGCPCSCEEALGVAGCLGLSCKDLFVKLKKPTTSIYCGVKSCCEKDVRFDLLDSISCTTEVLRLAPDVVA